jgi:hypothetical protein
MGVFLQPGAKLGRYEIRSRIGAGGMGEVYRARSRRGGEARSTSFAGVARAAAKKREEKAEDSRTPKLYVALMRTPIVGRIGWALTATVASPIGASGQITAVASEMVRTEPAAASEITGPETAEFAAAPAIVLLHHGEIWPMDPPRRSETVVRVRRRLRIQTAQGALEQGLVVLVPVGATVRLTSFEGSTTTSDGDVLPVGPKAILDGRHDDLSGDGVIVVFPRVGVGATLDYSYELRYATRFDVHTWFFQERLPVLDSQLRYHLPPSIKVRVWRRTSPDLELHEAWNDEPGPTLTLRMKSLPPIADLPFASPFADRASQAVVLPTYVTEGAERRALLADWENVTDWYRPVYAAAATLPRRLRRGLLHHLLGDVPDDDPLERARSLYRFVRDEIATSLSRGITPQSGASMERVLTTRRGSAVEKALLLGELLDAAGLQARLVWAGDRGVREVDPELPDPLQLQKLLVSLDMEGAERFLDPSDRRLPFGHLLPENEGVWGVFVDGGRASPFRLPATPPEQNRRRVLLDLAVDAGGRRHGTGELYLSGHHALLGRDLGSELADRYRAWFAWLQGTFAGFFVERVYLAESEEEQRLSLRWEMTERMELDGVDRVEMIGSTALPDPTAPEQLSGDRILPVMLPFAGIDEHEVNLAWTSDWTPDGLPVEIDVANAIGSVRSRIDFDREARSFAYRRIFSLHQRDVAAGALDALRELLGAKRRSDSEKVELVRTTAEDARGVP